VEESSFLVKPKETGKMSIQTDFQAFLTLLQSDLLQTAGTPLITLLTTIAGNKGNLVANQAAILGFIAQAPSLGISLGIELEQQVISSVVAKLQAAQKTPPTTGAAISS
jgi:hypothetical protein